MKRTKQKGGASPQLRSISRACSNSVTSSPAQTPDQSPALYGLNPPDNFLLSQSAPTTLGRSFLSGDSGVSRLSDFRSGNVNVNASIQHPTASSLTTTTTTTGTHPPTGLSLLMNSGSTFGNAHPVVQSNQTVGDIMSTMTTAQQQRYQQDLLEREHQASSLAAAGLVAEKVALATQSPPPISDSPLNSNATELDYINWNLMDNLGAMHLDDMDTDFATLFDPSNEMWINGESSNDDV